MATAIIPAWNEAPRVAGVVAACLAASSVVQVLVVDDGSGDGTAAVAEAAGAGVIRLPSNRGKGAALVAGAAAAHGLVAVLVDADLAGLTGADVDRLVAPVASGAADMAVASLPGLAAPLLQSGQRALPTRWLLAAPGLAEARYGAEGVLYRAARAARARVVLVAWDGVDYHATKGDKWGLARGVAAGLGMHADMVEQIDAEWVLGAQAALVAGGIVWPKPQGSGRR